MNKPTPLPADLERIYELPPECAGSLTFHLPLQLQALRVAGQTPDVMRELAQQELDAAFAAGLVDPPFYRWAVEHHRPIADALLGSDEGARAHAWRAIEPLGEGLAGAAFHGLIRAAYGFMLGDRSEIARGLAYMRCRRQVLFSQTAVAQDAPARVAWPEMPELRATIFDQLNLVAGRPGVISNDDRFAPIPDKCELVAAAVAQIRRAPDSFVAIHAVTGLHALVEIDRRCDAASKSTLDAWWRSYLLAQRVIVSILDQTRGDAEADRTNAVVSERDLIELAVASREAHAIKITVSLLRLAELELLDAQTALLEAARAVSAPSCMTPNANPL